MTQMAPMRSIEETKDTPRGAQNDTSAVDFQVTNYISIAAIFLIIAFVFKSASVPLVLVATIELAISASRC